MNSTSFEVVELFKDVGGPRLGVVHMPIARKAFSINIDNVRHLIRYAGKTNIRTLILPPHLPYGEIAKSISNSIAKEIGLSKRSPYIRLLKHIAISNSLILISMNVLEKSRLNLYVSNVIVDGRTGVCRFFSRKILLSQEELNAGIRPGNKLDLVSDYYLNYTALLEEEILAPELARLTTLMGAEVILISTGISVPEIKLTSIVSSLQMFTGGSIIHVGSTILEGSTVLTSSPTIIATPDESIIKYEEDKKSIITIPIKILKGADKRSARCAELRSIFTALNKYLKRIHTLKTNRSPK